MAADAEFALAVHDGAGTPSSEAMHPDRAREVLAGLRRALAADRDGTVAMPFSRPAMFRGYVGANRILNTAIFDEAYRTP
ncbi:MAG: hypothetical protein ACREFB_06565 [Stellaceae bacterium]